MAEAFANHFGKDVLTSESRGLAAMPGIIGDTIIAMEEKGIDVSRHFPQQFDPVEALAEWNIIVNMSGYTLPGEGFRDVREWAVRDPYMRGMSAFTDTRDDIERRVTGLILELRARR